MPDIQALAPSTIGIKTDVIKMGALGTLRVKRPTVDRTRFRRRSLQRVSIGFHDLMTRTTVRGLENIPSRGPLLVLPNHVSNLDGLMVLAFFPRPIEMLGPGDFKMIAIKDLMLQAYGVTKINRGYGDPATLRLLINYLQAKRELLMFPGGGMWEKREFIAKDGAAYLSQVTQTPILPVGLSGTYLKSMDAFRGQRPELTIHFGKVMPPVPRSTNRKNRDAELLAANEEIMSRIWEVMEPAEQAQYERWAREIYALAVDFEDVHSGETVAYDGPPLPDMTALSEFISKPNLFRPMWENAGLQLEPFQEARYFAPIELQMAARDLYELLQNQYGQYIPYRMGDEAADQVNAALLALSTDAAEWAMRHDARIRLTPTCIDPAE
ncbi:lysophospholipid acyltransferase family protein [Chloroflexota bacterium]